MSASADGLQAYCRVCSKAAAKKWQGEHPEQFRESIRKWQADRPGYLTEARTKSRAKRYGAEGSFTEEEWLALCESYGWVCLCCLKATELHRDHVIPLSKGGSNMIDNIQPLCGPCNSRKGTKSTDFRTKNNVN